MKNYALLIQLINMVEIIENQNGGEKEISLADFSNYIIRQSQVPLSDNQHADSMAALIPGERTSSFIDLEKDKRVENNISRIIVLLNRHVRNYTKKVFDDTPLQTLEEFSYLTMLYNVSSLTKSELINLNFQEKTSGTEVIKRLLAYRLAVQFDDQLDKRSQRVKITDSGKELIDSIAKDISSVSESLVSILPNKERERLLAILQKLDVYHSAEFSKNKVVKYRNTKSAGSR